MKIEEHEAIQKLADVLAIKYKNTDCFKMAEELAERYPGLSKKDIKKAAELLCDCYRMTFEREEREEKKREKAAEKKLRAWSRK